MSCNVPIGRDARVSGTNVTLVRSENFFVKVIPCFAFLPSLHPSFFNKLISFLPVMAGRFVYLRNSSQLMNGLNIWLDEGSSAYKFCDFDCCFGFYAMEFYFVFHQETCTLTDIFKGIKVKQHRFLYPLFSLCERTSECCCTEFFTTSNPSSAFWFKCKRQNYISLMHSTPFFMVHETFWWLLLRRYILYYYHHLSRGKRKFTLLVDYSKVTVLVEFLIRRYKHSLPLRRRHRYLSYPYLKSIFQHSLQLFQYPCPIDASILDCRAHFYDELGHQLRRWSRWNNHSLFLRLLSLLLTQMQFHTS